MVFPAAILVCQTARKACRESNVPVMLGIRLSRCGKARLGMLSGEGIKNALKDLLYFYGL